MNIINHHFFKRVYQKLTGIPYQVSYSQTGEDIIIDFLIGAKKIKNFTYLDIGANYPVKINNTYKFYEAGYKGVCIEPDPAVHAVLAKKRPKDTCLNVGIAGKASSEADFYVMHNSGMNTFSKEEANSLVKHGHAKLTKVIRMPLITVEEVIDKYFEGIAPVFINLDVEGLDEDILKSFPFHKYRPTIFCIETVNFTVDTTSEKRSEIFNIMQSQGYKPFADTYLNTIFINNLK